jgi:uncharacterized phage protein (TIGR01671 family)|tara:strand:- start:66037 stop:66417 length:381 start_codon:yes stop_codon:yes gene_type:complete
MRDIKFRVWEKSRNAMIYNAIEFALLALAKATHHTDNKLNPIGFSEQDYEHFEVMQFTNIQDKNEVDIYEGDIMRDKDSNLYEVSFHCGGFTKTSDGSTTPLLDSIGWLECKVIGNIYKDPELLKI